jgi:NAD(P)H-dependent FMN reductase
MTAPQTALLLVGSAKPAGESTSEALGAYLLQRLAERNLATETRYVSRAMRTPGRTQELLQAVDRADLIILAFPLYVDSLPYLVVQALERLAAHRQAQPIPSPASFTAIANCGFPEPQHNQTALAVCEQFAASAGFTWAGGLALGAGGAISGRPLVELGGRTHNVRAALDLVASALATGNLAPKEALAMLAQPIVPTPAYLLVGDYGWLMQARRNRALLRLAARPFKPAR